MPACTVTPCPAGMRYDTLVGPRCRIHAAPLAFGAVAEKPHASESCPACAVASTPHRDASGGSFLMYAAAIFRSPSSTRGVVPRLRKRWLGGVLKSPA